MESIAVLVLAAGLGKRMGSDKPKAATVTGDGRALVEHVLTAAGALNPAKTIVVTGHKRKEVEEVILNGASSETYSKNSIVFVQQKELKGTGDAVRTALPELEGFVGTVVILYGDVPLIQADTLKALIEQHRKEKATVSVITGKTPNPGSLGRIVRDESCFIEKIVEAADCGPDQILIEEINSGIYSVESSFLEPAVNDLKDSNAQGEYYITDIIERATSEGQTVFPFLHNNFEELMGVNTKFELAQVNRTLRRRALRKLIESGVEVEDFLTVFVDPEVEVAPGVVIGPNVQLRGATKIEAGVVIEGNSLLRDTTVGENALIKLSVRAEKSVIGAGAQVGPFAHLRPGSDLGEDTKVGNFVETKNAKLEKGAKASHLTYLGDCRVGEASNIGAGTITCNYDGYVKNHTDIGKGSFIGSNSVLVAPVTVEDEAYVGAGSVITKKVKGGSLTLSRAATLEVPGWVAKKKAKHK